MGSIVLLDGLSVLESRLDLISSLLVDDGQLSGDGLSDVSDFGNVSLVTLGDGFASELGKFLLVVVEDGLELLNGLVSEFEGKVLLVIRHDLYFLFFINLLRF
jgi:hypothetical protein